MVSPRLSYLLTAVSRGLGIKKKKLLSSSFEQLCARILQETYGAIGLLMQSWGDVSLTAVLAAQYLLWVMQPSNSPFVQTVHFQVADGILLLI